MIFNPGGNGKDNEELPYVVGSYNGNGVNNRNISVGFYPSLVIVQTINTSYYPVMSSRAVANVNLVLTETGFRVTSKIEVNVDGYRYNYIAFK